MTEIGTHAEMRASADEERALRSVRLTTGGMLERRVSGNYVMGVMMKCCVMSVSRTTTGITQDGDDVVAAGYEREDELAAAGCVCVEDESVLNAREKGDAVAHRSHKVVYDAVIRDSVVLGAAGSDKALGDARSCTEVVCYAVGAWVGLQRAVGCYKYLKWLAAVSRASDEMRVSIGYTCRDERADGLRVCAADGYACAAEAEVCVGEAHVTQGKSARARTRRNGCAPDGTPALDLVGGPSTSCARSRMSCSGCEERAGMNCARGEARATAGRTQEFERVAAGRTLGRTRVTLCRAHGIVCVAAGVQEVERVGAGRAQEIDRATAGRAKQFECVAVGRARS